MFVYFICVYVFLYLYMCLCILHAEVTFLPSLYLAWPSITGLSSPIVFTSAATSQRKWKWHLLFVTFSMSYWESESVTFSSSCIHKTSRSLLFTFLKSTKCNVSQIRNHWASLLWLVTTTVSFLWISPFSSIWNNYSLEIFCIKLYLLLMSTI